MLGDMKRDLPQDYPERRENPGAPTPSDAEATRRSRLAAMAKLAEGYAGITPVDSPPNLMELPDRRPRRRKVVLPVLLFLATCASTFFVGAADWNPIQAMSDPDLAWRYFQINWPQGVKYMLALLAILLTHEMGHFVTTLYYRIPASYPIFLPVPFNAIGTMGAVIGMQGMRANRREMFDLGLSGPLAGLVIALPVLWAGVRQLDLSGPPGELAFHSPFIAKLMIAYIHPELPWDQTVGIGQLNPYFMAGWVGMLITGLNMLPISQLDGGHVVYALFVRKAHAVARAFLILAILFIIIYGRYFWTLMLVLLIFMGTDHPPTSDDRARLGPFRWILGIASLAIPVFCFTPWGFEI